MPFNQRVGLLSALSALAFACSGEVGPGTDQPYTPGAGHPGTGATGGSSVGGSSPSGGTGGAGTVGGTGGSSVGGTAGSPVGGTGGAIGGTGGTAGSPPLDTGGVHLRLLTQAEYLASLQKLFGTVTTALERIAFNVPRELRPLSAAS